MLAFANGNLFATLSKCIPDTQILVNENVVDESHIADILVSSCLVEVMILL